MRICFLRSEEPLEGEKLIRNLGKVDFNAPVGGHPVSHGPLAAQHMSGHMFSPSPAQKTQARTNP